MRNRLMNKVKSLTIMYLSRFRKNKCHEITDKEKFVYKEKMKSYLKQNLYIV